MTLSRARRHLSRHGNSHVQMLTYHHCLVLWPLVREYSCFPAQLDHSSCCQASYPTNTRLWIATSSLMRHVVASLLSTQHKQAGNSSSNNADVALLQECKIRILDSDKLQVSKALQASIKPNGSILLKLYTCAVCWQAGAPSVSCIGSVPNMTLHMMTST